MIDQYQNVDIFVKELKELCEKYNLALSCDYNEYIWVIEKDNEDEFLRRLGTTFPSGLVLYTKA